jgi:hypothetical protein
MKRVLMLVMFTIILGSFIGFAIAESETPVPTLYSTGQGENTNQGNGSTCVCPSGYRADGNACNPECYYSQPRCLAPSIECKGNNISENVHQGVIVGASCGTVTPGYQNQCCISRGYTGWDAENFTCIGEKVEKPKEGRVVGGIMGAYPDVNNSNQTCPHYVDIAPNNCTNGEIVSGRDKNGCEIPLCLYVKNEPVASCGTVTPAYRNDCCQSKGYILWNTEKHQCTNDTNNGNNESVICPMDAKMCQDGTYVSRVGPHCEFAQCPKPINVSKEKVCCAIYGYGVNMSSTNINYQIIAKKECSIPENFVGGNREIVNDSYCIDQIQKERQDFTDKKWEIMQEKNRIKDNYTNESECPDNCTCVGSAMKCEFENGTRVMTILAGKSGNIIVQVKDVNASTNITLYKEDGKVYGVFRDNETHQIILPDEVRNRIQEMMKDKRGRTANLTNENITLNETGTYHVDAKKQARLFWLIPVKEKVQFDINSETGEVTKTKTKWWGFLAKDVVTEENSTVTQ